jgi:hypothetical protein
MLHPIQIPLEGKPMRIRLLNDQTGTSTDTPGSPRSKREIQGVLPLHPRSKPPTHEGRSSRMSPHDGAQSITRETRR